MKGRLFRSWLGPVVIRRCVSSSVSASRAEEVRALADSLVRDEQWARAESTLEGLMRLYPEGGSEWRRCLGELAYCRHNLNRLDDAARDYEAAISSSSSSSSPSSSSSWLGIALLNYAELRGQQERFAEAESLSRRAMEHLPNGSASWSAALCNASSYCGMQGRHDEAANGMIKAADVLAKVVGPDAEASVMAAANAVRALRQAGKVKEAEEYIGKWGKRVEEEVAELGQQEEQEVHQAMEEMWNKEQMGRKAIDPPGFMRDRGMTEEEVNEFMQQWRSAGLPEDEAMIRQVVEAMDNPQLDEEMDAAEREARDDQQNDHIQEAEVVKTKQ